MLKKKYPQSTQTIIRQLVLIDPTGTMQVRIYDQADLQNPVMNFTSDCGNLPYVVDLKSLPNGCIYQVEIGDRQGSSDTDPYIKTCTKNGDINLPDAYGDTLCWHHQFAFNLLDASDTISIVIEAYAYKTMSFTLSKEPSSQPIIRHPSTCHLTYCLSCSNDEFHAIPSDQPGGKIFWKQGAYYATYPGKEIVADPIVGKVIRNYRQDELILDRNFVYQMQLYGERYISISYIEDGVSYIGRIYFDAYDDNEVHNLTLRSI